MISINITTSDINVVPYSKSEISGLPPNAMGELLIHGSEPVQTRNPDLLIVSG